MALSTTLKFVIAGVGISLGLFFLVLACALGTASAWPMTLLIPFLFVVIPLVIVPPNPDSDGSFFESLANFCVGVAAASVVCLPIVLKHIKVITTQSLILSIFSIIFLITGGVFVTLAVNKNDSYMAAY
jgi:hypothetical protein